MNHLTALVSSAGRRCELISILRADAASLGLDCKVIATDMAPEWSAACHLADVSYKVPAADGPKFPGILADILKREQCNLLIPTIDTEVQTISAMRDIWERDIDTLFVLSHQRNFVDICRNKAKTMAALGDIGISVPTTYFWPGGTAASLDGAHWPLIAKPPAGSSSKGIRLVRDEHEFWEVVAQGGLMIQSLVEGSEYTINAFVTRAGEIAAVIPHQRISVRGGEAEKGIVEHLPFADEIVRRLVENVTGISGPFNFQLIKQPNGEYFVFEINPRLGGGYPLVHRAGGHFTRWAIEDGLLNRPISPTNIEFGWRMMRYDTSIFERSPNGDRLPGSRV